MEITKEQKVYEQVVQKAWNDNEFKKMLIANPELTIENFTGGKITLPEGKTLVVIDQANVEAYEKDKDKVYFVIPENKLENLELSESELERVAGGFTVVVHQDPKTGDITDIEWQFTIG